MLFAFVEKYAIVVSSPQELLFLLQKNELIFLNESLLSFCCGIILLYQKQQKKDRTIIFSTT